MDVTGGAPRGRCEPLRWLVCVLIFQAALDLGPNRTAVAQEHGRGMIVTFGEAPVRSTGTERAALGSLCSCAALFDENTARGIGSQMAHLVYRGAKISDHHVDENFGHAHRIAEERLGRQLLMSQAISTWGRTGSTAFGCPRAIRVC